MAASSHLATVILSPATKQARSDSMTQEWDEDDDEAGAQTDLSYPLALLYILQTEADMGKEISRMCRRVCSRAKRLVAAGRAGVLLAPSTEVHILLHNFRGQIYTRTVRLCDNKTTGLVPTASTQFIFHQHFCLTAL